MSQDSTNGERIHPNAVVNDITVEAGSSIDSIAPNRIVSGGLVFIPIHKADLNRVKKLFRKTDEETLQYYSERSFSLPGNVYNFVQKKRDQWENGDKFEYVVEYEGELVGKTYFSLDSKMTEAMIGLWLQKRVWGQGISQRRADMIMHVVFDVVGASVVNVGCVLQNIQSLRSIEKYIERYNGSFCGLIPTTENRFHHTYDLHQTVPHIEFSVSKKQYDSQERGISCTIPGISYDDVKDKLRVDSSTENG